MASQDVHDLMRQNQDRASKVTAVQKLVDEAFESGTSEKSFEDIWASALAQTHANRRD